MSSIQCQIPRQNSGRFVGTWEGRLCIRQLFITLTKVQERNLLAGNKVYFGIQLGGSQSQVGWLHWSGIWWRLAVTEQVCKNDHVASQEVDTQERALHLTPIWSLLIKLT